MQKKKNPNLGRTFGGGRQYQQIKSAHTVLTPISNIVNKSLNKFASAFILKFSLVETDTLIELNTGNQF